MGSNRRRTFLKRAGMFIAGGTAAIMMSRPANAGINPIEAIVKKIMHVVAKYYASDWMRNTRKQMNKIGKYLQKDGADNSKRKVIVIGASTDAINHIQSQINDKRLFMESAPAPTTNCDMSSVRQSAIAGALALEKMKNKSQLERVNKITNFTHQDIIDINKGFVAMYKSMSSVDLSQSLNASEFLTSSGYIDSTYAANFKQSLVLMMHSEIIYPRSANENKTMQAHRQSLLAKLTVVDDALAFLFARRIRSKRLADKLTSGADPTETAIIKRLKQNTNKLAIIDVEQYEVESNYLNPAWHASVDKLLGLTPVLKEMIALKAICNKQTDMQLILEEKANTLAGLLSLIEIENNNESNESNESKI